MSYNGLSFKFSFLFWVCEVTEWKWTIFQYEYIYLVQLKSNWFLFRFYVNIKWFYKITRVFIPWKFQIFINESDWSACQMYICESWQSVATCGYWKYKTEYIRSQLKMLVIWFSFLFCSLWVCMFSFWHVIYGNFILVSVHMRSTSV